MVENQPKSKDIVVFSILQDTQCAECGAELWPGALLKKATVAKHACQEYSRRVGLSAAAKEFAPEAIDLGIAAPVRHCHTCYDAPLATGWERYAAREAVMSEVQMVLSRWSTPATDQEAGYSP